MYDEFFSKAHELSRQGVPFATAIVVRAEKPSSGKPGDKAIKPDAYGARRYFASRRSRTNEHAAA